MKILGSGSCLRAAQTGKPRLGSEAGTAAKGDAWEVCELNCDNREGSWISEEPASDVVLRRAGELLTASQCVSSYQQSWSVTLV